MKFTKKTIATLTLLLTVICVLNAQQTPLFGDYNNNPFIVNAAYAGLTQNTEISISNFGYLNDIEGSPRTLSLSGHGSFKDNKMGVGAGIIRDEIGVTTSTQFFAAYAYKIFFDFKNNRPQWQLYDAGVLSFAVTAGVLQYQNNLADLGIVGDPKFAQNINASIPTIGLSVLFNQGSFYTGFSTPNVMGTSLASDNDIVLSNPYYGYFGYRFYNNRFEDLMIKPNVLLKLEDGAAAQLDINLAVSFRNKFEIGTGYRTNNAINFLAGIYLFNNFRAVYHFNVSTNNSPLGSTHGFILSVQFGDGYSK